MEESAARVFAYFPFLFLLGLVKRFSRVEAPFSFTVVRLSKALRLSSRPFPFFCSGQVVGTHSLLSRKVEFPNLGLLVIDEEQKFGVNQKEKLKVRERASPIKSVAFVRAIKNYTRYVADYNSYLLVKYHS